MSMINNLPSNEMIIRPMTKTIIPTATEGERERGGGREREKGGKEREEEERRDRERHKIMYKMITKKKLNSTYQPSLLC